MAYYLSQRAKQYLKKQERNSNYIFTSDDIVEVFMLQDINFSDDVHDAQLKYAGYIFSVGNDRDNAFCFYLIDSLTKPIKYIEEGGTLYFYISIAHRTAQFSFYLSSKGEVVVFGPETNGKVVVQYKSINSMIESYAYQDEIARQGFVNEAYYPIKDGTKLLKYLRLNTFVVDCNLDILNHYYIMDSSIVRIVRSLDNGTPLLTIYEKNKSSQRKDLLVELAPFLE